VLVKGGSFLEIAPRISTIAFDKTGTLTQGRPEVADVRPVSAKTAEEVLVKAAALEQGSNHPLAQAIQRAVEGVLLPEVRAIEERAGSGVTGTIDGVSWSIGSAAMARADGRVDDSVEAAAERMESDARTVLFVWSDAVGDAGARVFGLIGISDEVRQGAEQAVRGLRSVGIGRTVMLTGDNERTAAAVAAASGVDEFKARLLPQDKVAAVERLKSRGALVAMVGDGINDAPALAASDLGIAMGAAGSDTAIETADVALMSDDLEALSVFFELGRRTVSNIRQNVAFSVVIKLGVLLAAIAGYAPLWLAVFADTGVALLVILNGLRLLRPVARSSHLDGATLQ
jgi:Cd2+/Zn2+-exporting ATPase